MDTDLQALFDAGTNGEKIYAKAVQEQRNSIANALTDQQDAQKLRAAVESVQQTVIATTFAASQDLYQECFLRAVEACMTGMTGIGKFTMDTLVVNAGYLATQLYLKAKSNTDLIGSGSSPV